MPDLIDINTDVLVPQNVWGDKIVEVSDVVDTQKDAYHPTVYLATQYYNNVAKKRSIYIVPYKTAVVPFHVWNSLVEKAGFKLSDAPKTWDAFWDFFKPMQAKLRDSGMRNIYSMGMQCTTTGPTDGNNLFNHFLIANGGNGIVTKDGKVHLDDPKIKEAVIKAMTYITKTYKDGYVPSGALSWNDADDNNAFHSKLFVMDFDGTISTEVAIKDQAERAQVTTMGLPLGNDGKPDAGATRGRRRGHPKGREEHRCRQGFHEVCDPAAGDEQLLEGGTWPLSPGGALAGQERSVLARQPAAQGLHHRRVVDRDRAQLPGIQPGLG